MICWFPLNVYGIHYAFLETLWVPLGMSVGPVGPHWATFGAIRDVEYLSIVALLFVSLSLSLSRSLSPTLSFPLSVCLPLCLPISPYIYSLTTRPGGRMGRAHMNKYLVVCTWPRLPLGLWAHREFTLGPLFGCRCENG